MKNNLFKVFSILMSLTLIFNVVFSLSSSAASKSELEDQIADIQEEREKKQDILDSLKNDVNKQAEYVTALYDQINTLQKEIDLYQEKINGLNEEIKIINGKIEEKNKEIKKVEKKISVKEDEIQDVKEQLAVRIRATYMAGSGSTLKLLLSADNLASYLTTSEMLKRIADNDDKIVKSLIEKIDELVKLQDNLKKQKAELDAEKSALEKKKSELEAEQKVFTDRQTEISLKYKEANAALQTLDKESEAYKNQIQNLINQETALEQQIHSIINSSRPSGGSSSGGSSNGGSTNYVPPTNVSGYINPVPYSDRYVASVYGMRVNPVTGVYKLHAGIDISCSGAGGQTGPFTKQVVAAKAGTVSYAGWCSGYGNTVMITHDDGFLTLYAHNYSMNVSVGQRVSQGQQIAIMGTTGNSTGAHCHFEIRDGMWGNTMDPAPYI